MNRAERRRKERQLGVKRAQGKRGRRSALRSNETPRRKVLDLSALHARGFVLAKPKIVLPGEPKAT
jgi:hypothetical protein